MRTHPRTPGQNHLFPGSRLGIHCRGNAASSFSGRRRRPVSAGRSLAASDARSTSPRRPAGALPSFAIPWRGCSRNVRTLLAIGTVLFIALANNASAQDDDAGLAPVVEAEAVQEEGVAPLFMPGLAPAGQARGQNAPLEFLKPLINLEISFIKRACQPNDQQMAAIISAATEAYEGTGDMLDESNPRFLDANRVRVLGPGNEQLNENPYDRIRRDAARYLQPLVSKDQYERYQTESKYREEFERRAVVGMIVGLIDDKIAMAEQQRIEMAEMLMPENDGFDLQSLQVYTYNPQYLPSLPSKVVAKIFTEKQLTAWKSFNTTQISSFVNGFSTNQEMSIDEEWIK